MSPEQYEQEERRLALAAAKIRLILVETGTVIVSGDSWASVYLKLEGDYSGDRAERL